MRYALVEKNKKHVDAIARAAEDADQVLLATDPDREGEAIAWHLSEILKGKKGAEEPARSSRVVFYEITESAVKEGVSTSARDFHAAGQCAAGAPRARPSGRLQSVATALEEDRTEPVGRPGAEPGAAPASSSASRRSRAFKTQEYWTVHLESHKGKDEFSARLIQYQGEKVEQFTITTDEQQQAVVNELLKEAKGQAVVTKVERKPKLRYPSPPFITSTLQQEAVRKLGMTARARDAYRAAALRRRGYRRRDRRPDHLHAHGLHQSRQRSAARDPRLHRQALQRGLSAQERRYNTAANPRTRRKHTRASDRPRSRARRTRCAAHLTPDQARLYEMIWKRTLACQMTPARFDTTSLDISVGGKDTLFRASGQILVFPGFIAVYKEDVDDSTEEGEEKLPPLAEGEKVPVDRIFGEQHFTQPPPRYTEASLVKTLEEYGIGRPSTYASIISTLQDRGYALLDKKRFMPTDLGRLVNGFLIAHFNHYIDYDFTARMEDQLDFISNGKREWVPVLSEFWDAFSTTLSEKQDVHAAVRSVRSVRSAARESCFCRTAVADCSSAAVAIPNCDYTRPWGELADGPMNLGKDPKTDLDVLLMRGPYGYYVQLGPDRSRSRDQTETRSLAEERCRSPPRTWTPR